MFKNCFLELFFKTFPNLAYTFYFLFLKLKKFYMKIKYLRFTYILYMKSTNLFVSFKILTFELTKNFDTSISLKKFNIITLLK